MNKNIVIDKSIFGSFKSFTYSTEFNLSGSNFKDLYQSCIQAIECIKSQKTVNSEEVLTNLKGIDRINFAKTESEALKYEHQLLSYDVSYKTSDEKIESSNFSVVTPFHSFSSADINHTLKVISDSSRPLTLNSPLTESDLDLIFFQFGLDQFGMSKFSNWFFRTPVVLESFFLEAFPDKLNIYLQSEVMPENLKIIANLTPILSRLSELFNYDLIKDISESFKG